MNLWANLALRNLGRNSRRSSLTASTVLVGTALLTLTYSWIGGVFGGMMEQFTASSGHIRLLTPEFNQRRAIHPLYENITDVGEVIEALGPKTAVIAMEPRISTGVIIAIGEEIGDDFAMLIGAEESYYRERLRGFEYIQHGRWLSGEDGEVVMGRRIAQQVDAEVGDRILLLGQTQDGSMSPLGATVVGILSGDAMMDNQVYMSLEEVRWMADMEGGALDLLLYTRSEHRRHVDPVLDKLRSSTSPPLSSLLAIPWYDDETLAGIIPMAEGIRRFIEILMVLITALAIFNTMTMSVMERTEEIGVMRAMGMTRYAVVGTFLLEAAAIGLAGGAVGTGLGSIGAWFMKTRGITISTELMDKAGSAMPIQSTLYGDLNWGIVVNAVLLGVIMAVVGALLPALRAGRVPPVVAMKSRR